MRTRRRFILCCSAILLLTSLGFYLWLQTGPLRRSVIAAISKHYNGHVEVNRVTFRVGGGLVIKGLQLRAKSDPESPLICEIPRVELQGSFWDVLRGQFHPTAVTVRKPLFHLRQGPDGQWIHDLPIRTSAAATDLSRIPVEIRDACVEFLFAAPEQSQTRRISGIQLTIQQADSKPGIQFAGNVADPFWCAWQFSGTFQSESGQVTAHARSSSLQLKPQHAEWLGASRAGLWQSLQPAGQMVVDADITWDPYAEDQLEYQLLFDPKDVSLQIPTVSEKVRDVTGRIEVTSKSVRVHSLVGRLGTGEILASGTITRENTPHFNLEIDVRHVPLLELAGDRLKGAGRIVDSLTGTLQIEGTRDPQTWTGSVDGSLQLAKEAGAETIPLHLSVADGLLKLSDLKFSLGGGHVQASGRAPIQNDAIAEGRVVLEGVDLNALCRLAGEQVNGVDGAVTGELAFTVPVRAWSDGLAWNWSGPIELQNARFGKMLFESLDGKLICRERRLTLEGATGFIKGRTLRGNIRLDLSSPFALLAKFRVEQFDLTQLGSRASPKGAARPVTGQMDATGTLQGTLNPLALKLGGITYVQRLSVGGFEFGDTAARYSLVGDGFDFDGAELEALGGKIRLNGRWEWAAEKTTASDQNAKPGLVAENRSNHVSVRGSCEELDLASLVQRFSATAPNIRGRAKGDFQIDCPLNPVDGDFDPRITGSIESAQLRVGTVTVANAKANVQFTGGVLTVPDWSATLDGETISGSASIDQLKTAPRITAQATATSLDLAKVFRSAGTTQKAMLTRGSASGRVAVRWESTTGSIQGQGNVRLTSVVLPGLPPIDSISTSKFEIRDSRLTLRAFQAALWGGTARGTATIDLSKNADRLADVELERLERIDFARLTATWPVGKAEPRGKLSGAGKFHIPGNTPNRVVFGAGAFDLEAGSIFGLPVTQASGTLDAWDASTHEIVAGRLQPRRSKPTKQTADPRILVQIRDAKAARGNVQGAVVFALNRPVAYDTNLRFSGLDLTTVAKSLFNSQNPVSGVLSGEMQLHGTERGTPDLNGEFRRLRVDNGDLWHLPVVAVIVRDSGKVLNRIFNRDAPDGSQTVEAARVTLANGTLNIEEFRLYGDTGKLIGNGTVGLDGQVDLEVVGNFDPGLTKNVPILNVLQKAANMAQQRLVKFHIMGTLADPIAIPVPLQDVTEPAEKFLRGILTGTLFDDPDQPRPMRR